MTVATIGSKTGRRRRSRGAGAAALALVAGLATHAHATAADTTVVPADTTAATTVETAAPRDTAVVQPRPVGPAFRYSVFDSVPKSRYIIRHSYTLDHFLELEPGFFVGRFGPVGKEALVSRYSFGRGRAAVFLNGTPVNDPQNDIGHIAFLPVAGLGYLLEDAGTGTATPPADGLEGRLRIVESEPPPLEPATFLELSKSTQRRLRQRRVWFSSMKGGVGLDVGYDEVLNDGYAFDARPEDSPDYVFGEEYGRSHSRYLTINLRGELSNRDRYVFSLRRFLADSFGDLNASNAEQGLGGTLAYVAATMGPVSVNIFSRSYDATSIPGPSAVPDSNTVNLTTAGYVDWTIAQNRERSLSVGGGYEHIGSLQKVAGASSDDRIRKSSLRLTAVTGIGAGVTARLQVSGVHYQGLTNGWGGTFAVERGWGGQDFGLYLRRGYRMPNLGELFLPAHAARSNGSITIAGNRDLESEFGWEAGGRLTSRLRGFVNEVRVMGIEVHRPIGFLPATVEGQDWLIAANAEREKAAVIEDRFRFDAAPAGFRLALSGSGAYASSDREMYFRTVPEWNAYASLRFGRSIFQATSAIYIGADYTFCSSRRTVSGGELPGYQVLNLVAEGRLLDANLYLMWTNVLDERYETVEGFLMMPRTLVYGVAWQIFD